MDCPYKVMAHKTTQMESNGLKRARDTSQVITSEPMIADTSSQAHPVSESVKKQGK